MIRSDGVSADDLSNAEREHGRCPVCRTNAKLLTCWECCESAWTIDCAHYPQPRPLCCGRADGTESHRIFCDECAGVASAPKRRAPVG